MRFKRILKYFFYLTGTLLLIPVLVITGIVISYRATVSVKPSLNVPFQPGEAGKSVDPFIGTGGFPPYVSGATMPGATHALWDGKAEPGYPVLSSGVPRQEGYRAHSWQA
jgi:hypothetical protein